MDKKISHDKDCAKEVDVLAVSMRPSPILKGNNAKRLLAKMENPSNNKAVFEKSRELAKIFKIK